MIISAMKLRQTFFMYTAELYNLINRKYICHIGGVVYIKSFEKPSTFKLLISRHLQAILHIHKVDNIMLTMIKLPNR